MQELLQLPLQVQATLVAGYLGYTLLKRDYRKIEKITDVWLLVLVLGLPTAIILYLYDSILAYVSVLSGPLLAYAWVKWLNPRWGKFLQKNHVSHHINDGDVWKTLSSDKEVIATQIKLFNNNGSCYLCIDTSKFDGEPFAPFIMDDDGIAFYVTHVIKAGEDVWDEIDGVKSDLGHGSMITYFPRGDIKFLEMRYKK